MSHKQHAWERGRLGPVLATAGAVAALAGLNRYIDLQAGPLPEQLPADPQEYESRWGRIVYYTAGAADAPPLLLVHGHNAAASAYEFRKQFLRFAEHYHVCAPDLLGYGLSDRPPLEYTAATYIELIRDLLREVLRAPAMVVASSLSGAHAIQVAADDPEWITHLVLVAPTGLTHMTQPAPWGPWLTGILRSPLLGETLFHTLVSRAGLRKFLQDQTYYDPAAVDDDLVEMTYLTAHQPGARYAPAAFVGWGLAQDVHAAWPRIGQPVLLVWGAEAEITPASDAATFLALNPGAELESIAQAGLVPHDEQPAEFARIVLDWLERSKALIPGPL
ncbi:MAG TPA: alpha/beta hydrolase [Chloroflexia bacterium]|nr:alpha/beta hydrolase [Chloroflexia bacterium]